MALLEPLLGDSTLQHFQPLHAAHAELLSRAGDAPSAARAYERAIALSSNAVERAELEGRLSAAALKSDHLSLSVVVIVAARV